MSASVADGRRYREGQKGGEGEVPNQSFFEAQRPAALLKHGILRRYLRPFVQKTGSTSRHGRVAYIDGYAGPGVYDDGSPGSPAVAVETATVIVDGDGEGRIDGFFVEREPEHVDALSKLFEERGVRWPVFKGDVEENLPSIVKQIHRDTALFAFLDPFGLGIPLDMIEKELLSRAGRLQHGYRTEGAPTEVLLNFSFAGLRRRAGHLDNKGQKPSYLKAADTMIAKMDRSLGGTWWQEIWRSADPDEREELIRVEYTKRITALEGGWRVFAVDVSNGLHARPAYCLLLLTQHPDGTWLFNNAVSLSTEEWRSACIAESGEFDLEPLSDREDEWVEEIKRNLRALLDRGAFQVGAKIGRVYGDALGLAREMHVRRALNELHVEGVTRTDGRGNVQYLWVRRPR
jgi:three-Cys-motif partner protein